MSSKRVTVRYYRIETEDEGYFEGFADAMEQRLSSAQNTETFDVLGVVYAWGIAEKLNIFSEQLSAYFVSIAKEKTVYPVFIGKDGGQEQILDTVGDKYHLLVCPALKFAVAVSGESIVKRFLSQFGACPVYLSPYLQTDILDTIMDWDTYHKVSLRIAAPNQEAMENIKKASLEALPITDNTGALKISLSLGAEAREPLSMARTRQIISHFAGEPYCTSLKVSGCPFIGQPSETADVMHEPVIYSETLELDGHYLPDNDLKMLLIRAVSAKVDILREGAV
jgi:hypothetical protein